MMGETAFSAYFWGVYIWFAIGATVIGIPAIVQMIKLLVKKNK